MNQYTRTASVQIKHDAVIKCSCYIYLSQGCSFFCNHADLQLAWHSVTNTLFRNWCNVQVSAAARDPGRTYIADPPASWLDDFLSWLSPGLPHCCREDPQGKQCPPPDQYPCNTSAAACADCATCFTTGSGPDPRVLPHNRPTLSQVSLLPPAYFDTHAFVVQSFRLTCCTNIIYI